MNQGLKTQVRFGVKDVEVYTKYKGSDEPYKRSALEEIVDITLIPSYDHKIKWKQRAERPPRRKVQYGNQPRPSSKNVHSLSRQSSTNSQNRDKKRARTDKDQTSQKNMTVQPTGSRALNDMSPDAQDMEFEGVKEFEDVDEEI